MSTTTALPPTDQPPSSWPAPPPQPPQPPKRWYQQTWARVLGVFLAVLLAAGAIGSVTGHAASHSPSASGSEGPVATLMANGYGYNITAWSADDLASKTGLPASYFVGGAEGYTSDGQTEEGVIQLTDLGASNFSFEGYESDMGPDTTSVMNGDTVISYGPPDEINS